MADETKQPEQTETTDSGFKPIETQEALDALIKERLSRKEQQVRSEYSDFDTYKSKAEQYDQKTAEYTQKLSDQDSKIQELKAQVAKYETDSVKTRIATEYHLNPELLEFITATEETEIRSQIEKLSQRTRRPYPKAQAEPPEGAGLDADLLRLSKALRK